MQVLGYKAKINHKQSSQRLHDTYRQLTWIWSLRYAVLKVVLTSQHNANTKDHRLLREVIMLWIFKQNLPV